MAVIFLLIYLRGRMAGRGLFNLWFIPTSGHSSWDWGWHQILTDSPRRVAEAQVLIFHDPGSWTLSNTQISILIWERSVRMLPVLIYNFTYWIIQALEISTEKSSSTAWQEQSWTTHISQFQNYNNVIIRHMKQKKRMKNRKHYIYGQLIFEKFSKSNHCWKNCNEILKWSTSSIQNDTKNWIPKIKGMRVDHDSIFKN